MFKLKLVGYDELRAKLGRLPQAINDDADPILAEGAEKVAADMRKSILTGKRTGRMYGDHQASAPGEPPANRTGELVESIEAKQGARRLNHYVEAAADHARPLEFGTSKMAARPFMHPAMEKNRNAILAKLKAAIKKNTKKKAKRR